MPILKATPETVLTAVEAAENLADLALADPAPVGHVRVDRVPADPAAMIAGLAPAVDLAVINADPADHAAPADRRTTATAHRVLRKSRSGKSSASK